jgi:hypothetical protein
VPPVLGNSKAVVGTGRLVDVATLVDVTGGAVDATAPDIGVVKPTVVFVAPPRRLVVVWAWAPLVTVVRAMLVAVLVERPIDVVVVAPGPVAVLDDDSLPRRTTTVATPAARRMRTRANRALRGPRRTRRGA